MPSDAVPAPNIQLQDALRACTGLENLEIENIVVFYEDVSGTYGTLSSCCCGTHRVALMAAGMYNLEDLPMAGQVLSDG